MSSTCTQGSARGLDQQTTTSMDATKTTHMTMSLLLLRWYSKHSTSNAPLASPPLAGLSGRASMLSFSWVRATTTAPQHHAADRTSRHSASTDGSSSPLDAAEHSGRTRVITACKGHRME